MPRLEVSIRFANRFTKLTSNDRRSQLAPNTVFAFNKTIGDETLKYMEDRYPGDDYVDIIGFDCYDNMTNYQASLEASCDGVFKFALQQGKIPAIGETGHTDGNECTNCGDWWSIFLNTMNNQSHYCSSAACKCTWCLNFC